MSSRISSHVEETVTPFVILIGRGVHDKIVIVWVSEPLNFQSARVYGIALVDSKHCANLSNRLELHSLPTTLSGEDDGTSHSFILVSVCLYRFV
jgi:hypothetical protein